MNAKCAKCDSVAEYDIYTKVVKCSFCGFEATYDEYIGLMGGRVEDKTWEYVEKERQR